VISEASMDQKMQLWQIDVGYACAGIEVGKNNWVQHTAPIFKWMMGKSILEIQHWVQRKNGTMRRVV
jgi:hypothetical protein